MFNFSGLGLPFYSKLLWHVMFCRIFKTFSRSTAVALKNE